MVYDWLVGPNNSIPVVVSLLLITFMLLALFREIYTTRSRSFHLKNVVDTFVTGNRYKMVIVVRTDLSMGKGKISSQCCHAAIAAYKSSSRVNPEKVKMWENDGSPKIVLKTNNCDELKKIHKMAMDKNLISYVIRDAGRTQIEPNTITACAVGPDHCELIDEVCGQLKLL